MKPDESHDDREAKRRGQVGKVKRLDQTEKARLERLYNLEKGSGAK